MAATAVTPSGVRDGDPDALAGLCDRRGPAVLAYTEVVAGPARAVPAAAEAFGSFRAGVVATADLSTLDPEALLISATRHAAARLAAADLPAQCTRVPELLAARADRSISLADHDWLEQHLAECWTCRAPVARFDAADRAYHDPPGTRLGPEATAAIVAAMAAAAPVRSEVEAQAIQAAAASPNGLAAYAAPPPEQYDVPSLPEHEGAGVDQPTSSYVMPAEDLAAPEPPAPAAPPARRRRGAGRAAALLGALGRTDRESASSQDHGAQAADTGAGPQAQEAGAASNAMSPGARAARRARSTRAGRPTAATAGEGQSGGGSSLPRPRRTITAVPAQRRERTALRPALVLPIVLVVIAIIVALAIAGVFGGGEPASMPQSFAPRTSDEPTSAAAPAVVVVPGGASAADAVEKAKARARAARRRAAQKSKDTTATPPPAAAAPKSTPAAANAAPPPPPPPPPPPAAGGTPKIDADNGATGAEQLPPAEDTSTVPDLAPPVEPAAPPPG